MVSKSPEIQKLGTDNYNQWSGEMKAWLRANQLWQIVSGQKLRPTISSTSSNQEMQEALQNVWDEKAEKAAGWIYLMVETSQTVHLKGKEDDPVAMWKALESVHLQQKPGARFNAYDDLFSIRKTEEESLQSLVNRVDAAMQHIKNLRPKDFTLDKLDEELLCMTMIRSLPEDYSHFVSSLMLSDKLDKTIVTQAFHTEEMQRTRRSAPQVSEVANKASAAGHHKSNTHTNNNPNNKKQHRPKLPCHFCGQLGHWLPRCSLFLAKQTEAKAANTALNVQESAGKASIFTMEQLDNPLSHHTNYDWNADSGATSHMTPHKHWLRDYKPLHIPIRLADHTIIYSAGVGSILFKPFINKVESQPLLFSRVLHVPQLQDNLLSVLYLTKHKDYHIYIDSQYIYFIQSGRILFTASIHSQNAAFLDGITVPACLESANLSSTLPLDLSLWHRRFGHTNYDYVKQLFTKDMVTGMKLTHMSKPDPICEPCLAGKMHANPFPTSQSRATQPLELVHIDLKGPIQVKSIGGYQYWVQFVDDCTRFKCGLGLRKKSETFAAFLQFKAYAENLHDAKIKVIREDKGSEFMSNEFNQYCIDNGIERQHTVRNRPQQNGDVERANRTVSDQVTSMLNEANLPVQFWFHAFVALLHVLNRTPTAPLPGATPYEAWHRNKPDVSHIRVWGCLAYVHVQKDKRKSFGSHMEKCIFVGYPAGYKGWQFYNPVSKKFIISERAEFDERFFPGNKPTLINAIPTPPSFNLLNGSDMPDLGGHNIYTNQSATSNISPTIVTMPMHISSQPEPVYSSPVTAQVFPPPVAPESPISTPPPASPPSTPQPPPQSPLPTIHSPESPPTPPLALRRPRRNIQPPGEWWRIRHPPPISSDSEGSDIVDSESEDEDFEGPEVAGVACGIYEPNTYNQAMKSPDAELWRKAAEEEINSLNANGTWDIVPLPPDRKAIGSKWVFKVKRNADGSVERYKARVVAKGFSQRPGVDYTEVFSPTFRMASIRTIIALAARHDYHLHSIDISSAFLNGDLEEDIYMIQPPGFVQFGPEYVCKLKKSLYGLKQSARQWNKKLHSTLTTLGYKRLESDRSIYVYVKDGMLVIIPVFIDDITLASNSKDKIDTTIKELEGHFKLRNLGPTSWLLGMKITRDLSNHSISLSQQQYITDILKEYGFADCNPISTPMDPGLTLQKTQSLSDEDKEFMSKVPYLSAVGSLTYLAQCTRPDIAFAVGTLAKYNSNPSPIHWKAVKHVFRYLQGTKDYELIYKPDEEQELFITYTDANHGACKDTGRSTGGYAVKIGTGAVSWSSKLQSVVALSTTEAEYMAAVEAGKELKWMRSLLGEFGYKVDGASTLCIDNQSAINVSKNPEHHGRMKHLDLKFHWLRENVEGGMIKPKHVGTNDMIADCLTKPLNRIKHDNCRIGLGLVKSS
jgi:Reverse transcriptase (RNA-dependent DNA polymerase)/gag-polypeptide of LTR copia-type/GAG-pre-integrase domain/Integrase core domain